MKSRSHITKRSALVLVSSATSSVHPYRVSEQRRQTMARAGVNNAEVAVTVRGVELRFIDSR